MTFNIDELMGYKASKISDKKRRCLSLIAIASLALTSTSAYAGSLFNVLSPAGPVAAATNRLLLIDVGIMLLVIVPTLFLAAVFVRRYRATSHNGKYTPKWELSVPLEITVWGIPLVIVAILSYFVYTGIFAVNPYNPGALKNSAAAADKPLTINVVALDWKWLFIYPKQHIATVNTLDIPVGRRVDFRVTAASATNSFFIPQLAGQIYAMPGMRTKDQLAASHSGTYRGISANESGAGFSWMYFETHAVSARQFKQWVKKVRQSNRRLDMSELDTIAKPKYEPEHPVGFYSDVTPHLFRHFMQQIKAGKVFRTPLFAGEGAGTS